MICFNNSKKWNCKLGCYMLCDEHLSIAIDLTDEKRLRDAFLRLSLKREEYASYQKSNNSCSIF